MINESTTILILSLSFLTISLFVYNKTRKELYMFLFIIPYSYFLLTNQKDIIIYLLGTVSGYISDFIGVKRGLWKYPTKSGYSLWVGLGWGVVMLSLSKMQNISLILALILSAIYILISFLFDNLKFWNKSSLLVYPVFLLVLLGSYPKILLIAFFIGPLIEFVAVHILPTWKYYMKFSYFISGLSYGALIYFILITSDLLFYNIYPSVLEIIVFSLITIKYLFFPSSNLVRNQPTITKRVMEKIEAFKKEFHISEI